MKIESAYILAKLLRGCRKLKVFRGWDKLIRVIFPPEKQSPFKFQVPFEGCLYLGHANQFIDWNVFFYGVYEKDWLEFISEKLADRTDPIVLDVGANCGHHTLFFAAKGFRVHAFEPNPQLIPLIEEKVQINSIGESVTIHPIGLGNESNTLPFALSDDENQGTGSFRLDRNEGRVMVDLPITEGDEYISSKKITKCDLIKIDVEGFEKEVLEGLSETFKKYAPVLWVEFSEPDPTKRISQNFLENLFPCEYEYWIRVRDSKIFNIFKFQKIETIPNSGTFDIICIPIPED